MLDWGWLLQVTGACTIDPLIYGTLDKKLLSLFKGGQKCKKPFIVRAQVKIEKISQ